MKTDCCCCLLTVARVIEKALSGENGENANLSTCHTGTLMNIVRKQLNDPGDIARNFQMDKVQPDEMEDLLLKQRIMTGIIEAYRPCFEEESEHNCGESFSE